MPKDVKWCASCGEGTAKPDRADCKKCGATKFVTSKKEAPAKKKGLKDKGKDKLAEREANNKLKIRSQVMEAPGSVTAATDDDPVATDIPMDVKFHPLEG
jgi:predicted  nucleic acid-binding Zn-ribbon protein